MTQSLLLCIAATIPLSPVETRSVDVVEHHTRCDDEGCPKFRQWIFHEFNERQNRLNVVDWLTDNGQVQREGNTYIFHRYGVLYRVTASHYRESVTQSDPERQNAEVWPVGRRRGLWR